MDEIERDKVSRNVLIWLNTFPKIPADVFLVQYEFLDASTPGMALSAIQGTYITSLDIVGNYQAEYQFKVIYRVRPNSPDARLKADELLDGMGDWAVEKRPYIGDGLSVQRVEVTSRAALFGRYEDGYEDHQIIMRITYTGTME